MFQYKICGRNGMVTVIIMITLHYNYEVSSLIRKLVIIKVIYYKHKSVLSFAEQPSYLFLWVRATQKSVVELLAISNIVLMLFYKQEKQYIKMVIALLVVLFVNIFSFYNNIASLFMLNYSAIVPTIICRTELLLGAWILSVTSKLDSESFWDGEGCLSLEENLSHPSTDQALRIIH